SPNPVGGPKEFDHSTARPERVSSCAQAGALGGTTLVTAADAPSTRTTARAAPTRTVTPREIALARLKQRIVKFMCPLPCVQLVESTSGLTSRIPRLPENAPGRHICRLTIFLKARENTFGTSSVFRE